MTELFGRFHPLIVHLPIGILLIALLLKWLSGKDKYVFIKPVVPIVLLVGCIAAAASCITGYLLSISDDYNQSTVNWHMWMAISVVLVSLLLYLNEIKFSVQVSGKLLSAALFVLIMATGHLGGSLTHGSDYLTKPLAKIFSGDTVANAAIKPLANVQEALAYNDVIHPILETKCYSCHNANKQKGGLRMDDIGLLMKGGKNGRIIDLTNADSSEMLVRLLLPADNEHHMPPKEKPQPSESQVALLHWWITNKADFKKKVKELPQPEKIKPALLALEKQVPKKMDVDLPATAVEKADDKIIRQLIDKGFVVLPLAQNTNYLSATFTGGRELEKKDIELIDKLSAQLIALTITNSAIQPNAVSNLSKLLNIRRLSLSHSGFTDKDIEALTSLQNLQHLNLVGTKVTARGVLQLQKLKNLRSLFLYETNVAQQDFKQLKTAFPKTAIDSGNYFVPLLVTDTTLVKQSTKK